MKNIDTLNMVSYREAMSFLCSKGVVVCWHFVYEHTSTGASFLDKVPVDWKRMTLNLKTNKDSNSYYLHSVEENSVTFSKFKTAQPVEEIVWEFPFSKVAAFYWHTIVPLSLSLLPSIHQSPKLIVLYAEYQSTNSWSIEDVAVDHRRTEIWRVGVDFQSSKRPTFT